MALTDGTGTVPTGTTANTSTDVSAFSRDTNADNNDAKPVTVAFPDVCRTPTPQQPVPVPYPEEQYLKNLRMANRADARAANGNKRAKNQVKLAIKSATQSMGDEPGTMKGMSSIVSATQAVIIGRTIHKIAWHGRKTGR